MQWYNFIGKTRHTHAKISMIKLYSFHCFLYTHKYQHLRLLPALSIPIMYISKFIIYSFHSREIGKCFRQSWCSLLISCSIHGNSVVWLNVYSLADACGDWTWNEAPIKIRPLTATVPFPCQSAQLHHILLAGPSWKSGTERERVHCHVKKLKKNRMIHRKLLKGKCFVNKYLA